MNTVFCELIVHAENRTDRELLTGMFAKLDVDGNAIPTNGISLRMEVTVDDWSALCVLEDMGVLTVSQL